jgi:hypothetical protein
VIIIRQVFASLALCLLLSGCVLESQTPLFGDTQGVLALKALGHEFIMETFADGKWKAEEGKAVFAPEGRHYMLTAPDEKEPIEVLLVPLAGNLFVGQARESREKPFLYLIADVGKEEISLSLLSCDELKALGTFADDLRFSGGDCTFAGVPDLALFQKLAKAIGPAKSRLRRLAP